jgi:hypothetical protein
VSLVRAAGESLHDRWRGTGTVSVDAPPADDTVSTPARPSATFDRGMFTVPVGDRALRVAFMPPYLNTLRFSADELRARRGWVLTRRSLERMRALSRAAGTELVVMFVPFKEQIYLPLLQRSFSRDELQRALAFSLRGMGPVPDPEAMASHRLAQNELMRTLCAELGIAFLDLTPVLEAELGSGRGVYFPDDSHWNAAGHDVAAAALAEFLQARGILRGHPGP